MPKVGFLFGAGASFPFGIPMMRQFYTQFIDYIQTSRAHCMPLIESLTKATTNPDLEILIERLEQIRAIRLGLTALGTEAATISDQLDLADELRGYLDMFLIETCEKFDDVKVKKKLSMLAKTIHAHDGYVFTTNYDRLLEVAAGSIGIQCADGFEQASSRPESKWNGEFSSGLRLIKLHGSVNWYEEEDSKSLFRLERGYSLPSHEYRLTHGSRALRPLMIIPTLEKAVVKPPYVGLLTQFSDALKEVDFFVVIGNSLRDDHLRNTVMSRMDRLNILMINPSARDQVDIVNRAESTHPLPMGIEQFIDIGLQRFDGLLSELAVLPAADHRFRIASFASDLAALADQSQSMNEAEQAQLAALKAGSVDARLKVLFDINQSSHLTIVSEVRLLALTATDDTTRIAAIDALVDARSVDAAEVLAEIVTAPGSLPVRAEAALALKSLHGGAAQDAIRRTALAVTGQRPISTLLS